MGNNNFATVLKHVLVVAVITFFLAVVFTIVAELLTRHLHILALSLIFLLIIIIVHIGFDIIAIAATTAVETPFHAKSAKRVPGARQGFWLIRHADKVANFADDVIGDITATVSGALGISIAVQLVAMHRLSVFVLNVLITSSIASVSVAGKAFGKNYAVNNASSVVLFVGRILDRLERFTGIDFFQMNKKRKPARKK